jgi:phosphatidate cytidylyltransferase
VTPGIGSAPGQEPDKARPVGEAEGGGSGASPLRDLAPRLISALVMIALALATLWAGGAWFGLFWLAAALAIVWEWQRIVGGERARARLFTGTLALALAADVTINRAPEYALVIVLIGCAIVAWLAGPGRRLWNAAGLVYAAALLVSVATLRDSIFYGWQSILWLFAIVWGTDIMAYFGGRLIGGPKLWPRVSPKKTWAGFLTGIISGALAGTLVLLWSMGAGDVSILPIFTLGLVTAAISQGGDLFESSLKRIFDVKDSSHLIPGHGGVMDRLDGFIAAATFAAGLGVMREGILAAATGLFQW